MSIEAIRDIYVKPEEVDITPMDHEEIKQTQKEKPKNTGRNDDVGGAVKDSKRNLESIRSLTITLTIRMVIRARRESTREIKVKEHWIDVRQHRRIWKP